MRRGRVVTEWIESAVLRGNPCGDSNVRRVPIYLPPGYEEQPERRFPVLHVLSGFSGRGRTLLNDGAWSPSLDDRMDKLIAAGCGEMILVLPDCFTRYGGSQYLNSAATGRYEDHVIGELVPHVDSHYRTLPDRAHRGVAGKSSGGFGALTFGMRHADVFSAVACHSGDLYFDYCYRGDVPRFCSLVQEAGGIVPWLERFERRVQKSKDDMLALNILAMAASYSPSSSGAPLGIDLPCDLETGAFRDDVWDRWLEHDPLRNVERCESALRSLSLLYFDCGSRDEWHLHHGARLLHRELERRGIPHVHEEFDDGHMNVAYRYDVSLPRIAAVLA
jgi:S-formylglutathione hydrolase FrmB